MVVAVRDLFPRRVSHDSVWRAVSTLFLCICRFRYGVLCLARSPAVFQRKKKSLAGEAGADEDAVSSRIGHTVRSLAVWTRHRLVPSYAMSKEPNQ